MFKLLFVLSILLVSRSVWALDTVSTVDVKRSMGQWFEIASVPNDWQSDCHKNTRSQYSPNEDGSFRVKKSCIVKSGQLKEIEGEGHIVNKKTNAVYTVSYVPLLHYLGWFKGEYKMILVDSEYRFAVVGEDGLRYGWILARRQNIPLRDLAQIETHLRQMGYDTCKFLMTIQEKGPHQVKKPLCEVVKP